MFIFYLVSLAVAVFAAWLYGRSSDQYVEQVRLEAKERTEIETKKIDAASKERIKAVEVASNEKIAILNAEAENAKKERAEADEQIEIAKADAARAKQGIAQAEADAANATVEVARLQGVVANAETRRLEAERRLLELQERIAPRRLSAQQAASLKSVLSRDPHPIFLACKLIDSESCGFADDLAAVFKDSGWEVAPSKTSLNTFSGVTAFVHSASRADVPGLNTILLAFRQAGIPIGTDSVEPNSIGNFPVNADFIAIVVGIK